MRTVALVGLAETTRDGVKQSEADEIWSLNWAYTYDFLPRIDRLFEMHPIWAFARTRNPEYIKAKKHWKWLHKNKTIPVYMLAQLKHVPMSIRYPLQEVSDCLFGSLLQKGQDPIDFYTSSVDYMLALAIYEGFDQIELYGVEMGSTTEYRYQREGLHYFLGAAIARGIKVVIPENSILIKTKKYGYEGGQMIFRQDLERIHGIYVSKREESSARLAHSEGQAKKLVDEKGDRDEVIKAWDEAQKQRDRFLQLSGAEQALNHLLREIDLEEVEPDVVSPLRSVPVDAKVLT